MQRQSLVGKLRALGLPEDASLADVEARLREETDANASQSESVFTPVYAVSHLDYEIELAQWKEDRTEASLRFGVRLTLYNAAIALMRSFRW